MCFAGGDELGNDGLPERVVDGCSGIIGGIVGDENIFLAGIDGGNISELFHTNGAEEELEPCGIIVGSSRD